jgi:O-antigen ligase
MKNNLKIDSFFIIQLLIGLMFGLILLPSFIKSIAILFLGIVSTIYFFRKKNAFNVNLFFKNSSIFFFLILTLFYSENLAYGFNKMSTMASLFVFPVLFSLFNQNDVNKIFRQIKSYLLVYIIAVSLFNIVPFCWYLITQDTFEEITRHYPFVIIVDFGKYSIHPIYISMHTCIAILFSLYLLSKTKRRFKKSLLVMVISSLVLFLVIYSRKGPVLALIITLIVWSFLKNRTYLKYNVLLIFLLVGLFTIIPKTRNRFMELINMETAVSENSSSTNIRLTIYENAFQLIKKEPLFGYGIGDYNSTLKNSYKKNAVFLLDKEYNSHNQYISFVLIGGLWLLLLVIYVFYKNIHLSISSNNILLVLILVFYGVMMFFENILERENGVIFFAFFLNLFSLKNHFKIEK